MDVTCERCSTAYEFDDALVSERGTTVKCTNCGHQFKVRRPQAAGAPERWLVRTIDGRELEFRALRELQAAIAQAVITRDDVLSRGGSRPRRLGSIAELEPFFVSAGGAGPTHATSLGLGPRAPVITGHPDISRGRPSQPSSPGGGTPLPTGDLSMPAAPSVVMPPGLGRVTTAQGIGNVPAPRTSEVSIAIPLPRGPELEPVTMARPLAPAPPADRSSAPHRPVSAPPPPPPPQRAGPPAAASLPGVIVAPAGAPPLPPPPSAPRINEGELYEETTRAAPPRARPVTAAPARPETPRPQPIDDLSQPTAPFHIGALLDPAKVRAVVREDWTADGTGEEIESPVDVNGEGGPQNQHTASIPPLTPAPAAVRTSYADDLLEPRFSQVAAPPGRAGAARWMVGILVVGMLALAFATVGRKMLVGESPTKAGEEDARVGALLAEGEKSLADGDIESAKEQFDKASVLGEKNPRAGADLARLASAKADVEWLRARLLPDGDPEEATAKRELEQAAQRARKAADRAAELAPTDPVVLRSRIDALRLAGDLAGARKLVSGISAASAQPDNALTLAELDLAEAKPDWPTVLGRLRSALSTDGNLGRARSMLVYALARSGDLAAARAELDRLGTLPRPHPHPLLGALRAFLKSSGATLDPNGLPDASGKSSPGAGKPGSGGPLPPGPREHRERPAPGEPREPREPRPTPGEHVTPSHEPIDTSDLPGVKAPAPAHTSAPAPAHTSAPAPTSTLPPGVDTSDLPGFK